MAELLLATAGEDVRLWTMPDLNLHSVKSTSSNSVNYCSCSNNGQLIAYANEGQGINVSHLQAENTSIWEIPTACDQSNVSFSNSSRFLVSGGRDYVVNIWDVKSRTTRRTFRDHINPVSFCIFNINDKMIASSSDQGEIILTEVTSGLASDPLIGVDTETVNCLSYSHFTHYLLASAGGSGAVTLWDTNEKKLLRTFAEHNSASTSLAFSPLNDMLLCSTGFDKRIIFYDVCYKKIVKTINTEEPLTCCDFLHDGTSIAVGSASGHVYLFDLRHGATPLTVIPAHRTSVRSASFQKLPKERTPRRQAQEVKMDRNVSNDNKEIPPGRENIETLMEVSSSSQLPTKRSRNFNQATDLVPSTTTRVEILKQHGNSPSQEDSWRSNNSKSTDNLQSAPPKSAKVANEFFSPIALDAYSDRKPVKRSKSALKKYEVKSKNLSGENDIQPPGMGARSKSGLSRFSLLSRSTGDISKSFKKKEKVSDEYTGMKKNKEKSTEDLSRKKSVEIEKESVDGKKGGILPLKLFRKKNTDSKRSDESETSSIESLSIEDKMYMRGKRSHASNRSNESDTKSVHSNVTAFSETTSPSNKHILDRTQVINDTQHTLGISADAKSSPTIINMDEVNTQLIRCDETDNFQVDFVQKMIDEAMEENRMAIHNDMVNLQVEFIRQMEIQKRQIRQMLEHYSINDDLVGEIQRLRAENEMLKKKY